MTAPRSPRPVCPRRGACSAYATKTGLRVMHAWVRLAMDISEMRSKQQALCWKSSLLKKLQLFSLEQSRS